MLKLSQLNNKKTTWFLKMGKRFEQTLHQGKYLDGKKKKQTPKPKPWKDVQRH